VLVDIDYEAVPILPNDGDDQLDMSLCFLRSMSPIHIRYLKKMGRRRDARDFLDGWP
jgi:light-regulated signal transduction histidine kinase (bacteriophytochrome)